MRHEYSGNAGSQPDLHASLLDEIFHMEEILEALEGESVSIEEAVGMIGGLQRDTIELYRAAQP